MESSLSLLLMAVAVLSVSLWIDIVGNVLADENFTGSVGTSGQAESVTGSTTVLFDNSTELTMSFSSDPQVSVARAGTLQNLQIDVYTLCVCNLLVEQCDINCCCDPDCKEYDLTTFTTCDVQIVTDDRKLCNPKAATYFLDRNKSVSLINPSIFCIETNNYRAGSSFVAPEVPTTDNFDSLMKQFGGFSFSTAEAPPNTRSTYRSSSTPSSYQYGVPIKIVDGFLTLPAPLATSACADNNPAGFLVNRATRCSRRFDIATGCSTFAALNIKNYVSSNIFPSPNTTLTRSIPFFVASVTFRSLSGTETRLTNIVADTWTPNLRAGVCRNVVLEYNTTPLPLSGNPGYVVGLPLVAGFGPNASFGIIQSKNRLGQLTVMKSSANQDCLQMEGLRTPVLFGYNLMSGCILRIINNLACQQWSRIIRNLLIGQNVPQIVASFGNTPVQNMKDWVTIEQVTSTTESCDCEVPQSLALEVKWTKYGSFINPQARIVAVTRTIRRACILMPLKTEKALHISTSVTFTDVSASAQPGYKMQPIIDAKLPYNFFFPFV
ncbi:tectonic-1 isoform X2 [Mustelus asterias]